MARYHLGDTYLKGIDAYNRPERLGAGLAQRLENLMPMAGGAVESRAGWQGQFASVLGAAIYEPTPYEAAGSAAKIIFVSGGKLYQHTPGATTYTEIKKYDNSSFSLASAGVRMTRYGKYLYGVDGSGGLFRTDLTSGGTGRLMSLTAPTGKPTATLNKVLFEAPTAAQWLTMAAPTTGTLLTNSSFETGTTNGFGTNVGLTGWTLEGDADAPTSGSSSGAMVPSQGSFALLLDNPDNAVSQTPTTPALNHSGLANGRARHYYAIGWFHEADSQKRNRVVVSVTARDGSGNALGIATNTFGPITYSTTNTDWYQADCVFSFAALSSDPQTLLARIGAGPGNQGGVSRGIYIDRMDLYPISQQLVCAAGAGSNVRVSASSKATITDRFGTTGQVVLVPSAQTKTESLWIRRQFASPYRDFSGVAALQVAVTFASEVGTETPALRMGLQKSGSTTITWTNPVDVSDGFATFELTTISDRASIEYVYLQLMDDVAGVGDGGFVMEIGPINSLGSLGSNLTYYWRFEEWQSFSGGMGEASSSDGVRSGGSALSDGTTTSDILGRRASVVLPAAVNGGTTHYYISRLGGPYTDDYARVEALLPVGANASGTGWSWDYATRTFTDNIPDSALFDAEVYQKGRDAFPSGCTALCVQGGRLWAAKGNTIYFSWLLSDGIEAGLYTTLAPDPSDPYAPVKGGSFTIGANSDPDTIVALASFGTALLAFRTHSVSVITGFDSSNVAAQTYLADAGLGALAMRSVSTAGLKPWYAAAPGLTVFGVDATNPVGQPIQPLLSAPVLSATAYALVASVYHDRRMYVFAPAIGGSANTVAYVWDERFDAWSGPHTTPGFTSGCSLSGARDGAKLYAAGYDGQLYLSNGTSDKATPSGSASAIAVKMLSRRHGQQETQTSIRTTLARPTAMNLDIDCGAQTTWTWKLRGAEGALTQGTFVFPSGRAGRAVRGLGDIRTMALECELSASSTSKLTLLSYQVDTTELRTERMG